jgi:LysM repeat protein
MERAIFGAVILVLLAVQIYGALAGRRGVINVDGDEVAVVASPAAARDVIEAVRARTTQDYDGDVRFVEKVNVSREKRPSVRVMSPNVAEEKLAGAVHVGARLWAICVEGQPVLALDSREKAGQALALYASQNCGEEVGPAVAPTRFAEQVTIEQRIVPLDTAVESAEAACERLGDGKSRRAYHVVKEGETAYEIAHRYKIGYYALRDLNPGKDLDRLKIGDKLTVSGSEPLLTVVSTRRASLSEAIDYPVKVVKSPSLYKDQQVTRQQGRLGRRTVDAIVTIANGRILDREILESRVSSQPVAQVVVLGTKKRPSGYMMVRGRLSGEQAARRIFLMYRSGNNRGHFRGVYGMKELGVPVGTAHSLNHAFGVHYCYDLSWETVVRYLERGDHSFGGRWGCSGGPHDPPAAAAWIRSHILK